LDARRATWILRHKKTIDASARAMVPRVEGEFKKGGGKTPFLPPFGYFLAGLKVPPLRQNTKKCDFPQKPLKNDFFFT
jgi:hypothetical protein